MRVWRTVASSVSPRATRWTRIGRCGVAAAGTTASPSTRHGRHRKRPFGRRTSEEARNPNSTPTRRGDKRVHNVAVLQAEVLNLGREDSNRGLPYRNPRPRAAQFLLAGLARTLERVHV